MKRLTILSVLGIMAASVASAEPVFLPQAASVLKKNQLEAQVGGMFGYQKSEVTGVTGTTFKDRVWQFPIGARYGVLDTLETHLTVPITRAVDSSEGLNSAREASTGLGNVQIGAKWNFLAVPVPLAAAVNLDLPTANTANNPAQLGARYSSQVQEGFNAHLQLAADTPAWGILSGHAAVGYMNTATYSTYVGRRYNPSDLATFGAAVEVSLNSWLNGLSASGEFVGNTALNHSKKDGVKQGDDVGTVLEAGPAVRYQMGRIRTHAGVLFDAGPASYRAYNYRVDVGVGVLFGSL